MKKCVGPFFTLCVMLMWRITLIRSCSSPSFYIEQKSVVEGKIIESLSIPLLDECIRKCQRNPDCGGANFLLDLTDEPLCLLVDTQKPGMASATPMSDSIMYGIHQYCPHADGHNKTEKLPSTRTKDKTKCVNSPPWIFHKFSNYDVIDSSFIIQSIADVHLEKCLTKCQKLDGCASALYHRPNRLCRLSKVSLHNINTIRQYFHFDEYVDLYESNCAKSTYDSTQCSFLRVNQAGFTDLFDVILDGVEAKGVCEQKCLDSMRFNQHSRKHSAAICRSYVYDTDSQKCYLSHVSQRAFGRNVLENINPNLFSGDLDNCMQCE